MKSTKKNQLMYMDTSWESKVLMKPLKISIKKSTIDILILAVFNSQPPELLKLLKFLITTLSWDKKKIR